MSFVQRCPECNGYTCDDSLWYDDNNVIDKKYRHLGPSEENIEMMYITMMNDDSLANHEISDEM